MNARELFGHWDEVRRDLLRALDKLSDEQLHFSPREGLRSLGAVALHIASAEEGWFRYGVRRELAEWPADYIATDYPTVESIKNLLGQVHARTESYLEGVSLGDLNGTIVAPWGESLRLGWIVWHVFEHEVHHRGEIFLMLGLLGMQAPDI